MFRLSWHAILKHLNHKNVDASVFYNRHVMNKCVEQCLQNPDKITKQDRCFELIKTFPYDIGLSKFRERKLNTVRVVYTETNNIPFIITTYPIEKH